MKDHSLDWEIIDEVGGGGQGVVKKVRKRIGQGFKHKSEFFLNSFIGDVIKVMVDLEYTTLKAVQNDYLEKFSVERAGRQFTELISDIAIPKFGALKLLNEPLRNEQAPARMAREIDTCLEFDHPNLIKLLDYDNEEKRWYVCPFYRKGSLEKTTCYTGNVIKSLEIIRPVIEAVETMHLKETVHRDIKPQNLLISDNNQLILADPGLVRSQNSETLTRTNENAGSWDWSPEWTQRGRVLETDKTHDVFSFVKVIWAMIAGALSIENRQPLMYRYYWDDSEYDLRKIFPDKKKEMELISDLFRDVIVEKRVDCRIADASQLLKKVDQLITLLNQSKPNSITNLVCYSTPPLRDEELSTNFQINTVDSVKALKDGYLCLGNTRFSKSSISLTKKIAAPLTISMDVDATQHESVSQIWRVGFKITGQDTSREAICHIDNHNLVVGYLMKRNILSVPCMFDFSDNIVNLRMDISHEINSTNKRLYFHVNNSSYYIGELQEPGDFLNLSIEVWSDTGKKHKVIIRNIRIKEAIGISYDQGKSGPRLIK